MFNYSNNGITVASIMDDRRMTVEGLFPVKIRVTFNRERKYYSTGKTLSKSDWDKLSDTKSKKLLSLRNDIQYSFDLTKTTVQDLVHEGNFTIALLNSRLSRGSSELLNDMFKTKIESLLYEDRIGSYNYYKDTLKIIEEFAGKQIAVSSVTVDWLKKFEKYLLSNGRNYTTIGIRCRAIRAMMNTAKETGIIKDSQYPFGHGKYEIPTGQGRKLALSLQQIKALVNIHYICQGRINTRKNSVDSLYCLPFQSGYNAYIIW